MKIKITVSDADKTAQILVFLFVSKEDSIQRQGQNKKV
jgi:hypothetical protein